MFMKIIIIIIIIIITILKYLVCSNFTPSKPVRYNKNGWR